MCKNNKKKQGHTNHGENLIERLFFVRKNNKNLSNVSESLNNDFILVNNLSKRKKNKPPAPVFMVLTVVV